jgi:hypothetical protein
MHSMLDQPSVRTSMREYAPQVEKTLDKAGSWTDASKQALLEMCEQFNPQGSMDWTVRPLSPLSPSW